MPFSPGELDNIANATLDFFVKKQPESQVKQGRPFYEKMLSRKKSFPGGKGAIDMPVKGAYTTTVAGYTHDQQVTYQNPANIRRVKFNWREHHAGLGLTLTELKHDGISVVDSARSERTSEHSGREMTALVNLLEDKLEDMMEGYHRSMSTLFLGDGLGDANALAGLRALIPDANGTGTIGGLSRVDNAWWRHRSRTGAGAGTLTGAAVNPATVELPLLIKTDLRQLRRFGGRTDFIMAGSDFLDALIAQLYDKGVYTQQGWSQPKSTDISIADVAVDGIPFVYEPGLDDAGLAKYCYMLDTRHIFPYVMEGEYMKQHTPSRPHDRYVMYRAITTTMQLVVNRLNVHEVMAIV